MIKCPYQTGEERMIKLHRLNGQEIVINAELVESLESVPDTLVVLYTGNRYVVTETVDEVQKQIIAYQQQAHANSAETKTNR